MGWKVDTWPHCQGPGSNKLLIAATLLIVIFAHVFVSAGFLFTHRPLSLFHFPQKFRFQFYGILLVSAFLFVAQRAIRLRIRRAQQDRYRAMLLESGGSRQLSSSRSSFGSGKIDKLLPSPYSLGVQELSTKLKWLTFRAPKIVPVTAQMSLAARQASRSRAAKVHPVTSAPEGAQRSVHERV